MEQYFDTHRRVPEEWLYVHALRQIEGGACKGVCFVIEDGRACSVFNIASERGYGRFMLVKSIKHCCKMGYSTYDTGVSGAYGDYKSGIYLDCIETEDTGFPSFLQGPLSRLLVKDASKRRTVDG